MANDRELSRCRERLERLSRSTLDGDSIKRETIVELKRVIGFDRWCWIGADPDALVALSGIAEHDYGPGVARALELEYSGSDFAAMDVVARRATPSGSLSAETAGDLARSPRWDEILRPVDRRRGGCRMSRRVRLLGMDQGLPGHGGIGHSRMRTSTCSRMSRLASDRSSVGT